MKSKLLYTNLAYDCVCVCVLMYSMEGDEFSAGEEEGDFEEGGGQNEEMVEFINNGETKRIRKESYLCILYPESVLIHYMHVHTAFLSLQKVINLYL